ncbi:DUF1684 domain-containing protein [Oerskovia turbata]
MTTSTTSTTTTPATATPTTAAARGRHAEPSPSGASTDASARTAESARTPESASAVVSAASAWSTWHAERERALREERGWLTLTALHWVPDSPTRFAGLPGEWWAAEDGVHLRASTADGIVPTGAQDVLRGTHVQDVAEGASVFVATFVPDGADPASPVAVELVRRTGRYGLRVRDPRARARVAFEGVPTFAYDPSWVIDAPVRWYDEPVDDVVGGAQPDLEHHVQIVGEVDVTRDGLTTTLRLTGTPGGGASLLFTDPAPGIADWRVLFVDADAVRPASAVTSASATLAATAGLATSAGPATTAVTTAGGPVSAGEGDDVVAARGAVETLRLDLNRTLNLPFAFTNFGTCPRPVEGNVLPFSVEAGEKAPR